MLFENFEFSKKSGNMTKKCEGHLGGLLEFNKHSFQNIKN